jgi:hypothetical protein
VEDSVVEEFRCLSTEEEEEEEEEENEEAKGREVGLVIPVEDLVAVTVISPLVAVFEQEEEEEGKVGAKSWWVCGLASCAASPRTSA